jgi:HK97 family phage portal protein
MNFLPKFLRREEKNSTWKLLQELYGTTTSKSGAPVNWKTALQVSTVLRCTAVIADGISSIPLRIMRKDTATGNRQHADDHPLYDIFRYQPNQWMTSAEFRETLAFHLVLLGNAFVFKNVVRGQIVELLILDPARVEVKREDDWRLRYFFTNDKGQREELPPQVIWHLRGPSWNGYMGLQAILQAREAIGLSIQLESGHANLHRNGVQSSGVYSVDGNLSEEQYTRLRKYIETAMAGAVNTGKPFILDRGAKWTATSLSGIDSQHLETRRFQIEEVCRFMGVMPIMVGYSDKTATYASAEQMFLAHVVHTLRPWHRRIENSIAVSLLTKEERSSGLYPKFFETELLRGASKDRSEYYNKAILGGWLTRNEAREWEDLNPLPGLSDPLSPANMYRGNPPDSSEAAPAQEPSPSDPQSQEEQP